jgi:16S rRNA (guanine527-N7)-methyltransferase
LIRNRQNVLVLRIRFHLKDDFAVCAMDPSIDRPKINQDLESLESGKLLAQGAKALGITLSGHQLEQFMDYLTLLRKWNRVINLTGLRSDEEIVLKHFLDSLSLLPHLADGARIMDLGSGAGFPGLPIKIARPGQPVTLAEASTKKVSFLKEAIRRLNLGGAQVLQGYLGKRSASFLRSQQFEIITTRGVGKLFDLLAGVYPYLPVGGKLLLMKGKEGLKEISPKKVEIGRKGFRMEKPISLTLPFLNQERILIFLTKT